MPDYTRVNLKELEDSAADRGPDFEARFGRKHLDSQHLGVSYFRYAPGSARRSDTVTRSRRRRMSSSPAPAVDRTRRRHRRAPPVGRHARRAAGRAGFEGGPEGLEVIAIGADRPEGGDGVRVADWWPKST